MSYGAITKLEKLDTTGSLTERAHLSIKQYTDADGGAQSWRGLSNVTMEPIIAANTRAAITAHSQTVISTPFTGRTPPSG